MARPKKVADLAEETASSLERLKHLNDIQDVAQRIAVADLLCNHPQRADMILRWLTDLLKSDKEAGRLPQAWHLLAKSSRLISFRRLSVLAKAHHPMLIAEHVILNQLDETDLDLVREVHEYISFLLTTSASELSRTTLAAMSAEQAAHLFMSTVSLAQRLLASPGIELDLVLSILRNAIASWDGRKSSSEDNEIFQAHCWLATATLYNGLCTQSSPSSSRKRKLTDSLNSWSIDHCREKLERLMAVHVYVPARSSFNHNPSDQGSEIDLFRRSAAFFRQLDALDKDTSLTWTVLPSQLEVCLRCRSMRTHQQKLHERGWVNAFFIAIVKLWQDLGGPTSGRLALPLLVDKIIERNMKLSDEAVSVLLEYCNLETDSCNWGLLSRLIQLSRHTFADEKVLKRVLVTMREEQRLQESTGEISSLLRNAIVPALVQTYSNSRHFDSFLRVWQEQIALSVHHSIWFRCLSVDYHIAQHLEQAMTTDQIKDAAASRLDQLKSLVSAKKPLKTKHQAEFGALCVVLTALILGARSSRTEDALFSIAGDALELLLNVFRSNVKPEQHKLRTALFATAEAALSLWFPVFAKSGSVQDVAEKAKALLGESIVQSVQADVQQEGVSSLEAIESLRAARSLTSTAINMLQAYPDCCKVAIRLQDALTSRSDSQALDDLVRYEHSSVLLSESSKETAAKSLLHANAMSDGTQRIPPLQCFSGLADVQPQIIETLVEKFALSVASDVAEPQALLEELVLLPLDALSPRQLDRLVTAILSIPRSSAIGHLQSALPTQALLANILQARAYNRSSIDLAAILEFLCREPVYSSIRDDEWSDKLETIMALSRNVIVLTSKSALPDVDSIRDRVAEANLLLRGPLSQKSRATCKTVVCLAFCELAAQGDLVLVEDALKSLTIFTEQFIELDHNALLADQKLCKLLELCLNSALSCIQHPGVRDKTTCGPRLRMAAEKVMTRLTPLPGVVDKVSDIKQITIAPAVPAFGILCLDTPDLALLAFSCCRLLAVPFAARHRNQLIECYRHAVTSIELEAKLKIAHSLLSSPAEELDPCRFVVLDTTLATVKTVDKDLAGPRHALLATILKVARNVDRFAVVRAALSSITSILRHHSFLVNQYEIDLTLSTVHHLAKPSAVESLIFDDLCAMMIALLTHHRRRLNGRFHLVLTALQALLGRLLAPRQPKAREKRRAPDERHAEAFSQIITLLCEPPASRRKQSNGNSLVDQDRRVRANVGSFISSVLHTYCRLVLVAPPEEGVRQALLPAVSAMLGAMQVYNVDSVKVLSAAMTDSERAILRGLVETWRSTSKWSGI